MRVEVMATTMLREWCCLVRLFIYYIYVLCISICEINIHMRQGGGAVATTNCCCCSFILFLPLLHLEAVVTVYVECDDVTFCMILLLCLMSFLGPLMVTEI